MIIKHNGLVMAMLLLGAILFSNPELLANQFSIGPTTAFTVHESDKVGVAAGDEVHYQKWWFFAAFNKNKKDKNRYAYSYLCLFVSTDWTNKMMCFPIGEDLQIGLVKLLVMKNDREIAFVYKVSAHKNKKNVLNESLKIGGEKIDLKKGRVLLVKLPANAQDKLKVKQLDIELPDDIIVEINKEHSIPSYTTTVERLKKKSKEVREFLNSEKESKTP